MANRINYFIPFMRQGLAALADHSNGNGKRITMPVKIDIEAKSKQSEENLTATIEKEISLLGPGDVLGINQRMIVKTEPAQNSTTFEPNLIPFIEFAEPDFLWRFSTLRIDGNQTDDNKNWIPWLSLIILKVGGGPEEAEFTKLKNEKPELPPQIQLSEKAILPDLREFWRWAHIHLEDMQGATVNSVIGKIKHSPQKAVCRLLSPRWLKPQTKYSAFLVPTYRIGAEAAMGLSNETDRTALTWSTPQEAQGKTIPFYYEWEFRTSTKGDFEYLVKQLQPRKLSNLGTRSIDCSNPGYGLQSEEGEMQLEGALSALDTEYQKWGMDSDAYPNETQNKLRDLLNKRETTIDGEKQLRVTPPVYGIKYISSDGKTVEINPDDKNWLTELNLDFRHRVAAGLGVQFVKENQESLMQAAWQQLSQIKKVNRELNLGKLGLQLSNRAHKRLGKMKSENLLRMALPLQSKIAADETENAETSKQTKTIQKLLKESDVPNNLFHVKTRKYVAKRVGRKRRHATFRSRTPSFPFILARQFDEQEGSDTQETSINLFTQLGQTTRKQLRPNITIGRKLANRVHHFRQYEAERGEVAITQSQAQDDKEGISSEDLKPVMPYPEFHRPMYRFLRDLSQAYILPGLENIPENTVGLLTTNRRFVEAFMIGLNHEFASELRWREFPTDMRGSYFRKFWDTTIYSVNEQEKEQFRQSPIGGKLLNKLKAQYKDKFDSWDKIEAAYTNGAPDDDEQAVAAAYEQAVENWLLSREEEKDIAKLDKWEKAVRLGDHPIQSDGSSNEVQEQLVLLVRGELLQKFGNTLIYLVKKDNSSPPKPNYGQTTARVFPEFEGALPPDMVFIGFPITEKQAVSFELDEKDLKKLEFEGLHEDVLGKLRKMKNEQFENEEEFLEKLTSLIGEAQKEEHKTIIMKQSRKSGYFIVFEERMTDLRYGLDIASDDTTQEDLESMTIQNLNWQHFSDVNEGNYLDNTTPLIEQNNWNNAAFIARATVQKQVRVAIELNELMP